MFQIKDIMGLLNWHKNLATVQELHIQVKIWVGVGIRSVASYRIYRSMNFLFSESKISSIEDYIKNYNDFCKMMHKLKLKCSFEMTRMGFVPRSSYLDQNADQAIHAWHPIGQIQLQIKEIQVLHPTRLGVSAFGTLAG